VPHLEKTISSLKTQYSLAIITAGERWVQEKRLREFHLLDQFEEILVVDKKTPAVLAQFCASHRIEPARSWMVGDSVPSDIIPAKTVGLNVIYVQTANWAAEHEDLPPGVTIVTQLSELPHILL
jgi:putative hydrolase of the HAD superfamily